MNAPLVFRPYRPSCDDTVYHDILPHRSRAGRTLFVTWRLSDSLPAKAELESCLRKAQQRWLYRQRLPFCPWSQDVESIFLDHYPEKLSDFRLINFRVREQFDCKELGSCVLKHRRAVDAVRAAILEERKWGVGIGDHVVSCNHVHVLLVLGGDGNLKRHMQRIKGRASCYLGRTGLADLPKPVWQRYWFDHVIRNRTKLDRVRTYIANHPVRHKEAYASADWTDCGE